jgi:hypothetical protein
MPRRALWVPVAIPVVYAPGFRYHVAVGEGVGRGLLRTRWESHQVSYQHARLVAGHKQRDCRSSSASTPLPLRIRVKIWREKDLVYD